MNKIEKVAYELKQADHDAKKAYEEQERQRVLFSKACNKCSNLRHVAYLLRKEFNELVTSMYGVSNE